LHVKVEARTVKRVFEWKNPFPMHNLERITLLYGSSGYKVVGMGVG
jgi:hypothetical protein